MLPDETQLLSQLSTRRSFMAKAGMLSLAIPAAGSALVACADKPETEGTGRPRAGDAGDHDAGDMEPQIRISETTGQSVSCFWVVNAGPSHPCNFHVVGEQFDTMYLGAPPRDRPFAASRPGPSRRAAEWCSTCYATSPANFLS